jgi:HEAT repeat protein
MKNLSNPSATTSLVQPTGLPRVNFRLVVAVTLLLAAICVAPRLVSQAQKPDGPVTVKGISSQGSTTGTLVSIAADGSLSKAQTWQDSEGYHVVLPNTVPVDSLKSGRGVRVRKVGDSLELLLQTKPGTRVSVERGHNQLNFVIDGRLEPTPSDSELRTRTPTTAEKRSPEEPQYSSRALNETVAQRAPSSGENPSTVSGIGQASRGVGSDKGESGPPLIGPNDIIPQHRPEPDPAASQIKIENEDDGLLASVFSGTSVFVVISLGLFGLLVSRKLRSKQVPGQTPSRSQKSGLVEFDAAEGYGGNPGNTARAEKNMSLARVGESAATNGSSRQSVARMPVAGPTSLYGAYRIDQEVGKLLLGQPHRIDVLASRAIDDRRAIETSLIKGVNSSTLEEKSQLRAREALEEYGFVARQCAALLLAPDAFERTSAARTLGEIKSPAALPFLLEGLYDSESIVRNQAVLSIGELKLPSAIGALLDIARTHPDVPSALLSRTLSACSVEGLDFFDAIPPEPLRLGSGLGNIIEEITRLEPTSSVENLPESADDQQLAQALSLLDSSDVQMRGEALKALVQFRVQRAVDAIAKVARNDSEPNIRSLAISSLGIINHESVFPAVLIGMADDSREVRASAARSLSRLSFDRADAYVRVLETSDEETVRDVAKACIQSGIVSQNLDRLVSSDHRQAYETFSLICLLTQANMNELVSEAIFSHPNTDVRLKVVHLLAFTGHPSAYSQLRELAVRDGMREDVKTALLEAIYKLEKSKAVEHNSEESLAPDALPELESFEAETVEGNFEPRREESDEAGFRSQLDELQL